MKAIAFPQSFLERPEDRFLRGALRDCEGISEHQADLILYRIWADFATGGADRRPFGKEQRERQSNLIAQFCGLDCGQVPVVQLAIDAGFLFIETSSSGEFLVCKDFHQFNSPYLAAGKTPSTRKGAYIRAEAVQRKKARVAADEHLLLWGRTGVRSDGIDRIDTEKAVYFLHRLSRALHPLTMPADQILRRPGGVLEAAARILRSATDAGESNDVDLTVQWLVSRRRDPSVNKDFPWLLQHWPELVAKAKAEFA